MPISTEAVSLLLTSGQIQAYKGINANLDKSRVDTRHANQPNLDVQTKDQKVEAKPEPQKLSPQKVFLNVEFQVC